MKFSGCGVDCGWSVHYCTCAKHVKPNVAYFSDPPGVVHAEKCSPEPIYMKSINKLSIAEAQAQRQKGKGKSLCA